MYDLLVKNGKLVTPDRIYEADVAISDGKFAAFVAPGSDVEAKEVIQEGLVLVNGEIDTRRGRKLYEGDLVEFDGIQIKIEK